jgi:hypothetical protein
MIMPTTSSLRSSVRASHQLPEGTAGGGEAFDFFFAGAGLLLPRADDEADTVLPAGFPPGLDGEEGVLSGMFLPLVSKITLLFIRVWRLKFKKKVKQVMRYPVKYSTNGLFFFSSTLVTSSPAIWQPTSSPILSPCGTAGKTLYTAMCKVKLHDFALKETTLV